MFNRVKTVVLHVTTICEHNCPFCYYTKEGAARWHQSHEVLKNIVEKVKKAGTENLIFVGGDPALHPHIVALGKYAHHLDIETTILSNTLTFPNDSRDDVIDAFNFIETTIHNINSKEHDNLCRCNGAYRKAISNLRSFTSEKTNLGVVINLTPQMQMELYESISHIIETEKIPLGHAVLQRIASVGRAENKNKWGFDANLIENLFRDIELLKQEYKIDINLEDTFPYCRVPEKYRKYINPCSWGYDSCSLDLNGNISMLY